MSPLRNGKEELFLSFHPPYKAVGAKTLARYLLQLMGLAGVDTKEFQAHSTRGAAAAFWKSRAMSLKEICSKASWSLKSRVFKIFYDRYVKN